jgi:acetyl esterase/lipase
MNLARRGLFASLIGSLGGCSPVALLNATVSRKGYTLEPDIGYGPNPRQKLDLYWPDTPRADGKAVIFFYGGSWDSGRKSDYLFVAQALCASGYIVVIPDYRIYPDVRFPAFVEDGAQAVRWASDRVGSGRLFVMGHSAGAHIALMLMTNTPYLRAAGVDRMALPGFPASDVGQADRHLWFREQSRHGGHHLRPCAAAARAAHPRHGR